MKKEQISTHRTLKPQQYKDLSPATMKRNTNRNAISLKDILISPYKTLEARSKAKVLDLDILKQENDDKDPMSILYEDTSRFLLEVIIA